MTDTTEVRARGPLTTFRSPDSLREEAAASAAALVTLDRAERELPPPARLSAPTLTLLRGFVRRSRRASRARLVAIRRELGDRELAARKAGEQ